jgi:lipopolysaccharide biosynthesis regulator YciM
LSIESPWVLLGLLLLAGAVGFYASRRPRPSALGVEHVRTNYLAGVNFLVNEQPDRALEAFLRAVELDGDTVETHFALGSLYRRRGEVDRAIRIHQNIISRGSLEPQQREQAKYALAQDYLRAGLLDRAEALLEELAAAGSHRMAAMRNLIRIYEVERDWPRAIALHDELSKVGRPSQESAIAHYWCELADVARQEGRLDDAADFLRKSRGGRRRFPRGALVRADIAIQQGDAALASSLLKGVVEQDAGLIVEALPRLVKLARASGVDGDGLLAGAVSSKPDGWAEFAFAAIVNDAVDFPSLEALVRRLFETDETIAGFIRALGRDPSSLDSRAVSELAAVLRRLAASTPRYRCAECGFSSTGHFWQCPGCKTWDSQRPLTRFDVVAGLDASAALAAGP